MATAKIVNLKGEEVGDQQLSAGVFDVEVNTAVLHQIVTSQLLNRRQGNASTLTRSQVSGGNHKPHRQKGTGGARQGSTRSPQFRHGGSVFGPRPHEYHHKMMRNMRRIALRSALTDKAANNRLYIVNDLQLDQPKTRVMLEFLAKLNLNSQVEENRVPSVLTLMAERDENVLLSMRNIRYVKVGHVSSINVVELMKHDFLFLTPESLKVIEETYDDTDFGADAPEEE